MITDTGYCKNRRELREKSPYSEEKNEKPLEDGSSIPTREIFRFFPVVSGSFRRATVGSYRKKSENFRAGMLLPWNPRKSSEPAAPWPDSPTWEWNECWTYSLCSLYMIVFGISVQTMHIRFPFTWIIFH